MAERAKAKAKAKVKKKAVPKGATGSRGKVAKVAAAGAGHNSGLPDPVVVRGHHDKINGIEERMAKAKAALDKIKGELRSAYAVVKQDGVNVEDFKFAREIDKRDHGEVMIGFSNTGHYLACIKSPLATQMDLFQGLEGTAVPANPARAGAQAFRDKAFRSSNPFKAGTSDYVEYDEAWLAEANKVDLGDGEGQTVN